MFAYTGLLSLHAMGLAFAVGFGWFITLRVLGLARTIPLESVDALFPMMWMGFWVNFASGVPLLMSNATKDLTSPVFLIKITVIGLAVLAMVLLRREMFGRPPAAGRVIRVGRSRVLAGTAALLWAAAIVAGRLSEYPWLFGIARH